MCMCMFMRMCIYVYICMLMNMHMYMYMCMHTHARMCTSMGWLRLVGSLDLKVSFAECHLFYRALLQKRPIILRSLLIVATPYDIPPKKLLSSGVSTPYAAFCLICTMNSELTYFPMCTATE